MKKILFVTLDDFSNINLSLERQLVKHFPDHKVEILTLKPILKKDILALIISVIAVFDQYFLEYIKGHKRIATWRKQHYQTPFIMRYFNKIISAQLKKEKYGFVFQTQSLFDSSSEGTPNFIYTDHTNLNNLNYKYMDPKLYLSSPQFLEMEKQIYNRATLLFVMSENIRESLITQYQINPDKVRLVYVGSNTKVNDQVDQTKYANKNILFVGKDWERKGGPLLVEAFKLVLKSIPDASLTILGCNPSVKLPNCTILGDVSLDKVAEYYNRASVFCLPTKREPFGVVFIEAMLNRLAIVTSSIGATPELVVNNENGFRLNYTAPEYADALISLLNNPLKLKAFGDHSYQLAKQTYTWDNVGELIAKNINTALTIPSNSKVIQAST